MKGRMRPYLPELTIRDYNTYQWYQRGVRRQLYTTYGLYSCYGLRYNGVLFAVLADSLAGRPATCKRMREPGTLVWRQMMCQTQGIRLAAQVEVLLSWHRIQDAQWADLPFYKKVRRVVDTVLLRRAYRKAAAENPALERIFVQERDQANVQMTLNAKNYLLAAEPKGNLYGALYSVLATDDRNQRNAVLDKNAVGAYRVADGAQDALLFAFKHGGGKNDAERVYSRRHVLERDALTLKYRQHLACKADLGVHHVLFDGDG